MTIGADEDAALMLRVQQGDLAAFEALVERYKQPVFNFVLRILHDPDEAEDIAQQVFVQAWKAAGRYRVASRFSTWLYTIARNLSLNELRRRGRHRTESLDAPPDGRESETPAPEDARQVGVAEEVLLGELERKIEEALAALPEAQRTALLLFREKDLSYEEIAEVLGCSVAATKSLIHRARTSLKRWLKPYLRTGIWPPALSPAATFPPGRFSTE